MTRNTLDCLKLEPTKILVKRDWRAKENLGQERNLRARMKCAGMFF